MGKMEKTSVIYGNTKDIAPQDVKWDALLLAVAVKVGDEDLPGLAAAKKAVEKAKTDKKWKESYVKVGEVGDDLVLRIKIKGAELKIKGTALIGLPDTEKDITLLKGYKKKAAAFGQKAANTNEVTPKSVNTNKAALTEEEATKEARNEILVMLRDTTQGQLERAQKYLLLAEQAAKDNKPTEAVRNHGIALRSLQTSRDETSKAYWDRQAGDFASKAGYPGMKTTLSNDPQVKAKLKQCADFYKILTAQAATLDDTLEQMEGMLFDKDPETSSTDKTYRDHLKQSIDNYKSVVNFAKNGLTKVKGHADAVQRSGGMFDRLVPSSAMPYIAIQLKYGALLLPGPVKDVKDHIEKTIRHNGVSQFSKQAADWGLSEQDRAKNIVPLTDRIFALNTQIVNIAAQATQQVIDNLNTLIEKFGSDEELGASIAEKASAAIHQIETRQTKI